MNLGRTLVTKGGAGRDSERFSVFSSQLHIILENFQKCTFFKMKIHQNKGVFTLTEKFRKDLKDIFDVPKT